MPFHFFSACRCWLVLGGRRRVCTPSSEIPSKLSWRLPWSLELCLGVTVLSPVSPSHPAGPATTFHNHSQVRFQFPNKVLQFAMVPIAPGDALFVLPCSPSQPCCGSSSVPWAFCELPCQNPGAEFRLAAGQAWLSAPRQGRFSSKSSKAHFALQATPPAAPSLTRQDTRDRAEITGNIPHLYFFPPSKERFHRFAQNLRGVPLWDPPGPAAVALPL